MLMIIQLILEVIFYSTFLFMSKRKGFFKLLITFSLITVILFFLEDVKFVAYLVFILLTLLSLSFFVKDNKSSNILLILFMLIYKLAIELLFIFTIYIFIKDVYVVSIIVCVIKILITLLLGKVINKIDNKINKLWINNNFYIRYITTTFLMIYIVSSIIYLIKYYI